MIRIGLSDKRVLLVMALLSPLLDRLGDETDAVISSYLDSATQGAMQFGVAGGVFLFFAIGIGVILLLALISIAAAFLRYHDFKLHLDGNTLRSRGGLLTRHEVSMDLGKIQTLRLQQGIILRGFKRFRNDGPPGEKQPQERQQQELHDSCSHTGVGHELATTLSATGRSRLDSNTDERSVHGDLEVLDANAYPDQRTDSAVGHCGRVLD